MSEIQEKLRIENLDQNDLDLIDKFPQIKIPNKFFKNTGDMQVYRIWKIELGMIKRPIPTELYMLILTMTEI